MFKMFRKGFFLFAALLFLSYFVLCLSFSHIGVSWLWLWPLLSVFCICRFFMLQFSIHTAKWLSVTYYIVVSGFLILFIYTESLIVSSMSSEPRPGLDYVITLGAAVRDGVPTRPLKFRIQRTAEYLADNPNTIAIASGGQGPTESMSEAECIKEYLIEYGIEEERILLEDSSTDTVENINNSYSLIPDGASVGVVSDSYHIYRATRIAELSGHQVYGIPAITLLPLGIHYTVREFFAVIQLEAENLFLK